MGKFNHEIENQRKIIEVLRAARGFDLARNSLIGENEIAVHIYGNDMLCLIMQRLSEAKNQFVNDHQAEILQLAINAAEEELRQGVASVINSIAFIK